jgi:ABC-2 type transport system permease protein
MLGLGVASVFFFAGAAAIFTVLGRLPGGDPGEVSYAAALVSPLGLLFPLVGILIGYPAIVSERVSGTLRILLSLPHSRREVVLGKLLSRVTLALGTTLAGATAGYVSLISFGGSVKATEYALVIVLAMSLQATFVAISTGLSAGSGSKTIVPAAGLGTVVLFTMLWKIVVRSIEDLLSILWTGVVGDSLSEFLYGVNPVLAFSRLTSLVISVESRTRTIWGGWWFPVLVLLGWFSIPILIGVWRFELAEIS